jgi:alpha-beta hydrolase superfamily lysophospholipase
MRSEIDEGGSTMSSTTSTTEALAGGRGRITVRTWPNDDARYLVLLAHGLGEHTGRYEHVAAHLLADGAEVVGPDHWGHGLSEGEPGLVDDLEAVVGDLTAVADAAQARRPDLPLVVLGHSLGGIVATRFVQRNPGRAAALVLSGPVVGGNDLMLSLLDLDEIPDIPIDPAVLSRDPAVGEAYAADPLVYHGPLERPTIVSVKDAVTTIAASGDLGDLPTLWIHGELDPLAPVAETTRAFDVIGGSALEQKIYPGAMHEIFNETNQDEVLADVTTFLAKVLDR